MSFGIQCSSEASPFACRSSLRTATVTICAPLASSAAFMVGKSLYLPVPTTSREVKRCPPRTSSSICSASTHKGDDLQHVARRESLLAVPRLLHHLAVALDRHAVAPHAEVLQERRHGETLGQLHGLAVDRRTHYGAVIGPGRDRVKRPCLAAGDARDSALTRLERPPLDNTHLLRQVTIFQALPQDTIADLAKRVWHKQADAGSVIVSQEEAGDALFVIAKGKVKVVLYGETGREIILSILGAGDFFGEMALLDRQPRSANVVAVESSELLGLDREAFQTHLASHPSTAMAIRAEMSRRLRHADEVIGNLALADVYARLR